MGKSHFFNRNSDTTLDSDSSNFSWVIDNNKKIRNPEFPNNYITHIKENIGKYKYIFVSSHKEVRDLLCDNNIEFYLFIPDISRKDEFLTRYKNRGSDENFINLLNNNWENWINEVINEDGNYHKHISNGGFLSDDLYQIFGD